MTLDQVFDFCKKFDYKPNEPAQNQIQRLPHILKNDEYLIAMLEGRDVKTRYLFVLTNERLIYLNINSLKNEAVFERPLSDFKSISYEKGIFKGKLIMDGVLVGYDHLSVIHNCDHYLLYKFNKAFNELLTTRSNDRAFMNSVLEEIKAREQSSIGSLPDRLHELVKLKDEGLLTEEEFAAQKAKLLK